MGAMLSVRSFSRILIVAGLALYQSAQAHPDHAAEEMAAAANAFLATLKQEQKTQATFALKDQKRTRWHFVPTEMHPRHGLSFRDMTQEQQHMAYALLASVMSAKGLLKAAQIMSLEEVLNRLEKNGRFARDPKWYFVSIFGKPGAANPWGWRFEGHHLSLNFTVVEGQVAGLSPSFLGSNPATILSGPRKGLKVLAAEEDIARELVKSLDKDQRGTAIVAAKAPSDIITKADRRAKILEPLGLSASKMNKKQVNLLWSLIEAYARNYRPDLADEALADLEEAGLDQIHFAWAGGLEPRQGHYYRVQAPGVLIEYDNTQGGANHVHCVMRDLNNDFGDDLLRKHYEEHHKK